MTYEEYLEVRKRNKWLASQANWHSKHKGTWHRSQKNFYKRQAMKCWGELDLTSIVAFTMRFHAPQIAANVVTNNALFDRIRKK